MMLTAVEAGWQRLVRREKKEKDSGAVPEKEGLPQARYPRTCGSRSGWGQHRPDIGFKHSKTFYISICCPVWQVIK